MKKLILALVIAALFIPAVASAQIVDYQVNNDAKIKTSKIAPPEFSGMTAGGAVPTAAQFLATTKRALRKGDMAADSTSKVWFMCTNLTGPVWYPLGAGDATSACLLSGGANCALAAGTAALPSYTFTTDPDTGYYWIAANRLGISTGGTVRSEVNNTASLLAAYPVVLATTGTKTAPDLTFTADTDTGIYRVAANQLGVSANDTLVTTFTKTDVIVPTGVNLIVTDDPAAATEVVNLGYFDKTAIHVLATKTGLDFDNHATIQTLSYTPVAGSTTVVTGVQIISTNGDNALAAGAIGSGVACATKVVGSFAALTGLNATGKVTALPTSAAGATATDVLTSAAGDICVLLSAGSGTPGTTATIKLLGYIY